MEHGIEAVRDTLVAAIALGIAAQLLAHRLKLPAILPLLVFGIAAGPQALDLFDPAGLGHDHLEVLIHLGVAIILFEGGLSLDLRQLRSVSSSVRNLLVIGTAVTGIGAGWLAYALTDVSLGTAALFGAIVTVTGPTVIVPLLRHMIAPRPVRTVLLSEGLMIDPIGAVLAYLVLQSIGHADLGLRGLAVDLLILAFFGSLLGFAAGTIANWVIRQRHTAEELRSLTVLALLVGCFMIAEMQAPQSGILASVVMGLTVSAAGVPDLSPVRAFKGQLTVLIISVLFILLSAKLDLQAMFALGSRGLLVVAGLILLVRPLSVLLSVPPSDLDWRQRVVLGLTAPRGIVAAAVASLSAIQLRADGQEADATALEGLIYLTILITCTWATIMASVLPRLLGYRDDPSRRRLVLVGAHRLALEMARLFLERGFSAVVIDGSRAKLDELRASGVKTVRGDARDAVTYQDAGLERDSHVLALTGNDELNLLVAELVRDEFGIEHPVVALQRPSEELGSTRKAWVDLLGAAALPLRVWADRLERGQAQLHTVALEKNAERRAQLRSLLRGDDRESLVPLCGWSAGKPVFHIDLDNLDDVEHLTLLAADGETRTRLEEAVRATAPEEAVPERSIDPHPGADAED